MEPTDARKTAQSLIDQGYKSTSNKYRFVARLPEGMTGLEALKQVAPDYYEHMMRRIECEAVAQYLRAYSKDYIVLTPEEFMAFKQLGGEVA